MSYKVCFAWYNLAITINNVRIVTKTSISDFFLAIVNSQLPFLTFSQNCISWSRNYDYFLAIANLYLTILAFFSQFWLFFWRLLSEIRYKLWIVSYKVQFWKKVTFVQLRVYISQFWHLFLRIVFISRNSDFFQHWILHLISQFRLFSAFFFYILQFWVKKCQNCEIKSLTFSGRNGPPYYSVLIQRVLLDNCCTVWSNFWTATTSYFEILINLLRLQGLFVDLFAPYQDFQTKPEPPTAGMLRLWWSLLNMLQHASSHLFPSFSLLLAFFLLYICRTIFCFIVPGKLHTSFSVVKRYIEDTIGFKIWFDTFL